MKDCPCVLYEMDLCDGQECEVETILAEADTPEKKLPKPKGKQV